MVVYDYEIWQFLDTLMPMFMQNVVRKNDFNKNVQNKLARTKILPISFNLLSFI